MSWLSDLFGGGEQNTVQPQPYDTRNPEKKAADSALSSFISKYLSQYQPGKSYGGRFVAPMTKFESAGLSSLGDFMNQPNLTPGISGIQKFLQSTINGGFDPNTSPVYQATRDAMNYNNRVAVGNANADFGQRGKFFSTAAMNKVGDINAQTSIGMNQTMADLANRERDRQMSAVNPASEIEKYIYGLPLAKTAASQTYGSLPRTLDQADLEAQYQDFIRQQKELGGVAGAAGGISSTPMEAYQPPTLQRDNGQQTGQLIGQLLPFVLSLF